MEWNKEDSIQVDLAGSERIKESGSEGVRLTEAQVLLGFVQCTLGCFKNDTLAKKNIAIPVRTPQGCI